MNKRKASTVSELPEPDAVLVEVRFFKEHVGAISPASSGTDDDVTNVGRHEGGRWLRLRRFEFSTGEARQNTKAEALICRNDPTHKIVNGAYFTVEDTSPICLKCRPFEVIRPLP